MPKTNPDRRILKTKNIVKLIRVIGIMYFTPSLSSPFDTKPRTREARMFVVIMNVIEKYFMKSIEIFTE